MDAVSRLHALPGTLLVATLALLALWAGTLAVLDRAAPAALELARRILLAIVVATAALGLVLAVRGRAPDEGIHWIYGGLIVVALLLPRLLPHERLTPRLETASLAAGAALAAIFAWRLWGSG